MQNLILQPPDNSITSFDQYFDNDYWCIERKYQINREKITFITTSSMVWTEKLRPTPKETKKLTSLDENEANRQSSSLNRKNILKYEKNHCLKKNRWKLYAENHVFRINASAVCLPGSHGKNLFR